MCHFLGSIYPRTFLISGTVTHVPPKSDFKNLVYRPVLNEEFRKCDFFVYTSKSANSSNLSSTCIPYPRVTAYFFFSSVRCMMYGFGDDQNPYTESVDILEDLVIEFITEMVGLVGMLESDHRLHVRMSLCCSLF